MIFNPGKTLAVIDGLPFNQTGRYLQEPSGDLLLCWVSSPKPPQRLIFGKTRRRNLPQEEKSGNRKPLKIDPDAGLSEVSHMIWFPDNVLAVEFNFHGPRVGSFHYYLSEKAPSHYTVQGFDLLLKKNAVEELKRLKELRVFTAKLERSASDLLSQANKDLASALDAQMDALDADEVEVTFKVRRKNKHGLSDKLLAGVRGLAPKPALQEKLDKLVVKGPSVLTGKLEEVDLLRDELVVTKGLLKIDPRGRAINAESAFGEIEAAYEEVKGLLPDAMSLIS